MSDLDLGDVRSAIADLHVLREAARQMRERAAAACPGPWFTTSESARYGGLVAAGTDAHPEHDGYAGHLIGESMSEANREHVAPWHPAVVLAVADWLEAEAFAASRRVPVYVEPHALAVARAYLRVAVAS